MGSVGWLVCRNTKNGGSCSERALLTFKTIQGRTSRLERDTASHKNGTGTLRFQPQLPIAARMKVVQAAAMAVCLGIHSLPFCDRNQGMHHFAKAIFEMGQTVPENEKIDMRSYLSGRTAVTRSVKKISYSIHKEFMADVQGGLLKCRGAITIDGAHFKMQ